MSAAAPPRAGPWTGPRTKTFFRWDRRGVGPAERVLVVGSCEELGAWDPARGVPLRAHEDDAACWVSRAVRLPLGRPVQYKYLVREEAPDGRVAWEAREANRHLVPTGRRLVVEDDGGKHRHLAAAAWDRGGGSTGAPEGSDAERCESALTSPQLLPAEAPRAGHQRQRSFAARLRRDTEVRVTSGDDVVVVFRSLPVRLERDASGAWAVDRTANASAFKAVALLQQALQAGEGGKAFNITFVGDPGVRTADPEERRRITEVLAAHSCVPVFLDQQTAEQHLEFCHLFLWPVMHNMKVFEDERAQLPSEDAPGDAAPGAPGAAPPGAAGAATGAPPGPPGREAASWRHYQVFNRAYAEAVEAAASPEALVWVHDFYLLLVPRYLSLRRPEVTVGFFLHSAFPSSEVLRCIPMREEILHSLLSCRVATFQTFEYTRHFLSGCTTLLNASHGFRAGGVMYVEHEGRCVVLRADHFALPYSGFAARVGQEAVRARAAELRRQLGDRLIFASIDGDEPFSGLVLKLRAFHRLLKECPQYMHRVVLLQHVLARKVGAESEILHEVKRMAEETNRAFGQAAPLVVVAEGDLDIEGRLALLQAANVFLDTSINDGLNLNPFVFCCAHTDDMKGSMIVSEFCGCSSFLTGSIKVNPWDTQAVVNAMHAVITMEDTERDLRFKRDHSYVATQKLIEWVDQNLCELKHAREEREDAPVSGLGAGSQLFFMECGFRHLSQEAVVCDYRAARTRAIFLDIEGTLAPDRRSVLRPYSANGQITVQAAPLDPQVLDSLRLLASDRANVVTVISGREQAVLEGWFREVEGVGLCAEHGCYWVLPGRLQARAQGGSAQRWQSMAGADEDDDWKTIALELVKLYAKRVQGSVAERKGSAIVWNYRKVGAQMICKEMAMELMRYLDPQSEDSLMHGYPVVVSHGKGYVEVKRSDVHKGIAVERVLREVQSQIGAIDFVLCIGDDRSDEDMFGVVNDFTCEVEDDCCSSGAASPLMRRQHAPSESSLGTVRMQHKSSMTFEEFNPASDDNRSKYYSVTVGRKPSKAAFFVKDVGEVSELLQKLASQAIVTKLSRFVSMPVLATKEDSDSGDGGP